MIVVLRLYFTEELGFLSRNESYMTKDNGIRGIVYYSEYSVIEKDVFILFSFVCICI